MSNDETNALLREIRDLLAADAAKLDLHLEKSRQLYEDYLREVDRREANRPSWLKTLFSYFCVFFIMASGVFVGVLVGLRVSRP